MSLTSQPYQSHAARIANAYDLAYWGKPAEHWHEAREANDPLEMESALRRMATRRHADANRRKAVDELVARASDISTRALAAIDHAHERLTQSRAYAEQQRRWLRRQRGRLW